jgi:RNA-directed DNA polymerase
MNLKTEERSFELGFFGNLQKDGCLIPKLRGHVQYYGISHNTDKVDEFIGQATKILYKWLNRRSQKRSFNWEKFNKFKDKYPILKARVVHALF